MTVLLLKLGKWLAGKTVGLVLAAALVVVVYAVWSFARDQLSSERSAGEEWRSLQVQAQETYAQLNRIHGRLIEVGKSVDENRRKLESARAMVDALNGILDKIQRLLMTEQERAEQERRLAEAQREQDEASRALDQLLSERSQLRLDRVALTELGKSLEKRLGELEGQSSTFLAYLRDAWHQLRTYIVIGVVSIVTVPVALKVFAYYLWAPVVERLGAIRFEKEALPLPELVERGVSTQLRLEPRQRIWVRESMLQSSDESLKRKTRFVLNWKIPFTCLAAGLVEMVELGASETAGVVTVSSQKRSELEVAHLRIPEGGRLIVRPSLIAGIVSRSGDSVLIRRRWRVFNFQAWLTFQFRYFEFSGPCDLLVNGVRGVRLETLAVDTPLGRRSNAIATIGFSPDLRYGVARAETFWSYFRSFNPLFDDVFRGRGVFLCQEITDKEETTAARFWAGIWNAALKLFGV